MKCRGGPINPDSRGLIQSCYRRWGWVRRKATQGKAKKTDSEIAAIKREWIAETNEIIRTNGIRDELILNFDEISSDVMPAEDFTVDVRGVGHVKIAGVKLAEYMDQTPLLYSFYSVSVT